MRGAKGSVGELKTGARQKAGVAKWKYLQDKYNTRKANIVPNRPTARKKVVTSGNGTPVKKTQRLKKR